MATGRWFLVAAILALSATVSGAEPAIPRGQLPDDVRPERYRLQLDVDPRQERFSGTAQIEVTVARPLRNLWLHGHKLDVHRVTVDTGTIQLTGQYEEVEPINGVARVELSGELPPGRATLRFEYTAPFAEGGQGLYRVQAGDDWYAFTQFEAIDARRAFPGFDEPRFKTPFEVSVVAHGGDRVITNAPLKGTTPAGDGRAVHEFQATLPLPTYLLAFAIGPLDVVDATLPPNAMRRTPLPLRGVATKGKGPELAYALKHTPAIVERLETYFGIPYPYPKLDLIASPQMGGAMENAGAIIFNDTLLLLDEGSPPAQQRSFYEVMAHEVAHHWFGDLVTPAWWDDIWLNESFAQWMGVKIADQLRPDLGSRAGLVYSATYAMDVDSKRAGRPMRQAVTDNAQISSTFDSITYQKGGSVLSMVESYLGEGTFREGVRGHLQRHQHGIATSSEFFAALSVAAKQPAVVAAFRSFVEQPGVPLVSVDRSGDGRELKLTQDRYLPLGTTLTAGQLWQIPVCVTAYGEAAAPAKKCTLLAQRSGTVPLAQGTKAVMPNADGAGYYRFALGAEDLSRLIAIAPTLPETEAIMLADSVAAAFRAGRLPFDQFLVATQRLATHPSRLASVSLGWELIDIKERWVDPATRKAIAAHLRELYAPRLAGLGLDVRRGAYASESAERRQLRRSLAHLVVMHGLDPVLRAKLADAARASLTDPAALDREFRALAWSIGVQDLGDPFAQSLEALLLASDDSQLRQDAATGIGAAEDPKSSARALALVGNPALRTMEMFPLLGGQLASPVTRDAAWDWLEGNFDRVLAGLPGYAKDGTFGMAEAFCDAKRRPAIEQKLTAKAKEIGSGELEVQRTLEGIDLCVAQRAALGPSVVAAMPAR
jgi:aminopeptidase N